MVRCEYNRMDAGSEICSSRVAMRLDCTHQPNEAHRQRILDPAETRSSHEAEVLIAAFLIFLGRHLQVANTLFVQFDELLIGRRISVASVWRSLVYKSYGQKPTEDNTEQTDEVRRRAEARRQDRELGILEPSG